MAKILLSSNATTGVDTFWHDDEDAPGSGAVETVQQLDQILDFTHAQRVASDGQRFGSMRKVGSIPMVHLSKMMADGSIRDQKAIRKFFAENPMFRTFEKTW
jgi:hypothetical protein